MIIFNAKVFYNGSFINGGIEFNNKIVKIGDKLFNEGDIDAQGCFIIPGLVDIHTHGAVGEDVSDGKPDGLKKLSLYYASKGVTSWCPTTMTLKESELCEAISTVNAFIRPSCGAKIAGINMEGPFLSSSKIGAQNQDNLHKPDITLFKSLYDLSKGKIKIVSVAPEEDGAMEFIKHASEYATISIAHTNADYDTAISAYYAGATHTTHLFNAMPGIHHRNPGIIPAASDCGASIELITDGIHIHPAVVRMTDKVFGDKLVLISDSIRCAGMPDGDYSLGGLPVTLKNDKVTLSGTDTIAGSSIHLMDGLKKAVEFGISFEHAVVAASLTPAKVIRMDDKIGSLEVGKCADFVILDDKLNIVSVYIDGIKI